MSILFIFVGVIIILQIILFIKTRKLIKRLKKVLSGEFSTGRTIEEDVAVIRYKGDDKDIVSANIENSINTYLRKNKGAVSDFNLIKDIVERNCDTLEAEISSQTPLPLYLGLMGTVAGIILGLFTITVSGGFSNIQNVIEILMSDVAIAMIASFVGIGLTTLSIWKSKQCKVIVEENKNRFYTWFQTTLLPVISKSAVSAITLLQQNLTRFNESFTVTIHRLEEKLGDIGDVYESQIEVLQKIESIDVKKMAVANVKVLQALDGSMGSLDAFAQYMSNVTEYLNAVRDINQKLDDHLERTEALGVVSDFYRKQMNEIELRQDAIKSAVLSVDDVMKSALATLQTNSEQGLRSMQEAFVVQMMAMQEMISKQTEKISAQMNQMPQVFQKLDEISNIPSRLDKLIDRIEKSNTGFAKQVSQSLKSVSTTRGTNIIRSTGKSTEAETSTPWIRWGVLISIIVIALVCVANLTVNILNLKNSSEESNAKVEDVGLVELNQIEQERPIMNTQDSLSTRKAVETKKAAEPSATELKPTEKVNSNNNNNSKAIENKTPTNKKYLQTKNTPDK